MAGESGGAPSGLPIRWISWLFAAKCFTCAITCSLWIPRISAAAICPERNGSSPNVSAVRPHSGTLRMFTVGPRRMLNPFPAVSAPSAAPNACATDRSQDAATTSAFGNAVFPAPPSRTPFGPSDVAIPGMPSRGTPAWPLAASEIFSSRVICASSACARSTGVAGRASAAAGVKKRQNSVSIFIARILVLSTPTRLPPRHRPVAGRGWAQCSQRWYRVWSRDRHQGGIRAQAGLHRLHAAARAPRHRRLGEFRPATLSTHGGSNMRISECVAFLTIVTLLGAGAACADDKDAPLAATLRKVIEESYTAYNRKNVDDSMSFIDSKSPGYEKTKKALPRQFDLGSTNTKLVDFRYIGQDDEFAVARVKTKTTGKPGTSFVDNVVDTMTVFHQENGQWKVWDQLVLGVATP